jgi:hypothetical protein
MNGEEETIWKIPFIKSERTLGIGEAAPKRSVNRNVWSSV